MPTSGMTILPQYQGDYYQLQRQQAIADALLRNSLTNQAPTQTVGSGPYQVMPRMSPLAGLSQLGQALASAKMGQNVTQGMRQLGQQQWGALTGMMGGSPSPQPGAGSADAGAGAQPGSGSSEPAAIAAGPRSDGGNAVANGSSPLNPTGMNPQLAAMMYLNAPDKFFAAQAAAYAPTDLQKLLRASGIPPDSALGRQIIQQNISKQNYIPPVNARPGAILRDPVTMQPMAYNPHVPDGGTPVFDASGNVVRIQPLPGAADVAGKMAAAKTAGEGTAIPYSGVDASGNPLPVTNRTAAATGQPPNAGFPAGTNVPGPGVDTSSQLAILKQGRDNIVAQPDSPSKTADLAAIDREIARHNGTASGGQIYAAPPMGATTAANAAQGAPSKQMADSYGALSNGDSSYQQSREALTEMLDLARNKGVVGGSIGMLPEGLATRVSPDAAKYQKLHATFVALQGKALGGAGTDSARATIDEAVPTYDKPQSAMVSGLQTQLNNLDLSHLKTQFLTPIYQAGNEKAYTQKSAAFDQNITPAMVPTLQLSGDAQRSAVQAAIKANPSLRPKFEWAFNNGLLK